MAVRKYSNTFAETTLTGSISNSTTTIAIGSTAGLPASFPYTLALDYGTANVEMVTVTALAGSNLTVTRGQDGTSAQSHNAGARVVHPVSARDLSEPQVHMEASADVHGLTGGAVVVGTSTAQTLTNKTISGAANTLSNIPNSAIVAVAAGKISQPFDSLTAVGANGAAQVLTVTGDEVSRTTPVATFKRNSIGLGVAHDSVVDISSDLQIDTVRVNGALALASRLYVKATTKVGIIIQRVASQSQNLLSVISESAAALFTVASTGAVTSASSITAATSLNSATLAVSGNSTVGGTLGVTGALTASGGVAVTGSVTGVTNVTATGTVQGGTVNGTTDVRYNGDTLPRGYVNHLLTTSDYASTGTTEVVGPTVTFTAVAGRRYKLVYSGAFAGDTVADTARIRVRYQAGGTLTTSGTQNRIRGVNVKAVNFIEDFNLTDQVTGIAAGQTTIGLTVQRSSGTGVVHLFNDANQQGLLLLEDLGD